MLRTGWGSRHVPGEVDAVHTVTYRCILCGHSDFSPKMAADTEDKRKSAEPVSG